MVFDAPPPLSFPVSTTVGTEILVSDPILFGILLHRLSHGSYDAMFLFAPVVLSLILYFKWSIKKPHGVNNPCLFWDRQKLKYKVFKRFNQGYINA